MEEHELEPKENLLEMNSDFKLNKDVNKMEELLKEGGTDDEEFWQSMCNTGLKLKQDGKTIEELKLMVTNG